MPSLLPVPQDSPDLVTCFPLQKQSIYSCKLINNSPCSIESFNPTFFRNYGTHMHVNAMSLVAIRETFSTSWRGQLRQRGPVSQSANKRSDRWHTHLSCPGAAALQMCMRKKNLLHTARRACVRCIFSEGSCIPVCMSHNTLHNSPVHRQKEQHAPFHSEVLRCRSGNVRTGGAQVKHNLPLQNDAKAAARVCHLKAEVIHTGGSVKTFIRCAQ